MQQVLRTTTSASSRFSVRAMPSATSTDAIRSESCSFIWHPNVRTRKLRPSAIGERLFDRFDPRSHHPVASSGPSSSARARPAARDRRARSGLRQRHGPPGGPVALGASVQLSCERVEASLMIAHARLEPLQDCHALAQDLVTALRPRAGAVFLAKGIEPVEGVEMLADLLEVKPEQGLQLT